MHDIHDIRALHKLKVESLSRRVGCPYLIRGLCKPIRGVRRCLIQIRCYAVVCSSSARYPIPRNIVRRSSPCSQVPYSNVNLAAVLIDSYVVLPELQNIRKLAVTGKLYQAGLVGRILYFPYVFSTHAPGNAALRQDNHVLKYLAPAGIFLYVRAKLQQGSKLATRKSRPNRR